MGIGNTTAVGRAGRRVHRRRRRPRHRPRHRHRRRHARPQGRGRRRRAGARTTGPAPTRCGVLAAVGGLEIAALAGFIAGRRGARVPVVVDGVIAGAAALVAAGARARRASHVLHRRPPLGRARRHRSRSSTSGLEPAARPRPPPRRGHRRVPRRPPGGGRGPGPRARWPPSTPPGSPGARTEAWSTSRSTTASRRVVAWRPWCGGRPGPVRRVVATSMVGGGIGVRGWLRERAGAAGLRPPRRRGPPRRAGRGARPARPRGRACSPGSTWPGSCTPPTTTRRSWPPWAWARRRGRPRPTATPCAGGDRARSTCWCCCPSRWPTPRWSTRWSRPPRPRSRPSASSACPARAPPATPSASPARRGPRRVELVRRAPLRVGRPPGPGRARRGARRRRAGGWAAR